MIRWMYADKFGELTSPEAEKVEALVEIAEQLESIKEMLERLIVTLENKPVAPIKVN